MAIPPERLQTIAFAVRRFLEPRWRDWPGVEVDARGVASGHCGRASTFLQKVLSQDCGLAAQFQTGNPLSAQDRGAAGYLSPTGWKAHSWVRAEHWVIDITHDQYGGSAIAVRADDSPDYCASPDLAWPSAKAARLDLSDALWPKWLASDERAALR